MLSTAGCSTFQLRTQPVSSLLEREPPVRMRVVRHSGPPVMLYRPITVEGSSLVGLPERGAPTSVLVPLEDVDFVYTPEFSGRRTAALLLSAPFVIIGLRSLFYNLLTPST